METAFDSTEVTADLETALYEIDIPFVNSLRDQFEVTGELTPRQISALRRVIADVERKARLEAKWEGRERATVPSARVMITGEALSIKWEDNPYSPWNEGTFKVLIGDDSGYRAWGTLPRALWETEVGDRLSVIATVTPSRRDRHFGYFKRPVIVGG